MPELNPTTTEATTPATESPTPATPKASKPKVKAAAKKVAKSKPAPTKQAEPARSVGRAPKEGLRSPQIRILKYLNKATKPVTRNVVAEKSPVDVAACVEYLGSHDKAKREANDKKHFPSLITLGLVKAQIEEDTGVTYQLTAKGKTTAARL